jgi:hypothetical protein
MRAAFDPAHKVTPANDFMGLPPPLRHFHPPAISRSMRFAPRRNRKASKTKEVISPSETKRFAAGR